MFGFEFVFGVGSSMFRFVFGLGFGSVLRLSLSLYFETGLDLR